MVGSFLLKNLLIHWREGARWLWNCLVDPNLASNSASWQWVAGCRADAEPYFRIFNPVTQGQKLDPEGKYVRQYIPKIAKLPNKYLLIHGILLKIYYNYVWYKLGQTLSKTNY